MLHIWNGRRERWDVKIVNIAGARLKSQFGPVCYDTATFIFRWIRSYHTWYIRAIKTCFKDN